MRGKEELQPARQRLEPGRRSVSPKSDPSPFPQLWRRDELRANRVVVNIIEHAKELTEARDYPREEPVSPKMTPESVGLIVADRESLKNPFHDFR